MTESRANRVRENDEWRYLDDDEAEFVLFACPDWNIESVDDFIDGLHGVRLPEETINTLLGFRHDARQAYRAKNVPLMEAHLRGLDMACRAAGMLDAAKAGVKFLRGRKPNTHGPIRKSIARLLMKSSSMKNPELWAAIAAKPPRGWQAFENLHGKYFEGPQPDKNMSYSRFCNVAGEERKRLKA